MMRALMDDAFSPVISYSLWTIRLEQTHNMSLCMFLPIMNDCLREGMSFWTFAFGKAITHCVRCRGTMGSVSHLQHRIHHCLVPCVAGRYVMMDSRWYLPFIADHSIHWDDFSITDPLCVSLHTPITRTHESPAIIVAYILPEDPLIVDDQLYASTCSSSFIIIHDLIVTIIIMHNASHLTLLSVPLTGCSSLIRFISL